MHLYFSILTHIFYYIYYILLWEVTLPEPSIFILESQLSCFLVFSDCFIFIFPLPPFWYPTTSSLHWINTIKETPK